VLDIEFLDAKVSGKTVRKNKLKFLEKKSGNKSLIYRVRKTLEFCKNELG
jgi:hypothetical protein